MTKQQHPSVEGSPWETWVKDGTADVIRAKFSTKVPAPDEIEFDDNESAELRVLLGDKTAEPEHLRVLLQSVSIQQLHAFVLEFRGQMESGRGRWERGRNRGAKKITTSVQEFANRFDKFLGSFGPMAELAKVADEQYGGAVTVALALLFVVSTGMLWDLSREVG